MWTEVSAELTRAHSPLDVRVANAVRRLWSMDESERLQAWAPGTVGPAAGAGLVPAQILPKSSTPWTPAYG